MGAVAFSFQIYGDFSGYSDIALGTAKLFGFELLSNFKFPYFSRDIAEFWRRWHISLSSWFKDYLYIPLGGSKEGKWKAIQNTFIIFLVSGFWHGASWNFITWGFIHACGFLPLLLLKRNRRYTTDVVAEGRRFPSIRELFQMLGTFAFVTTAWVFFRAETLGTGLGFIGGIFKSGSLNITIEPLILLALVLMLFIDWVHRKDARNLLFIKNLPLRYLTYAVIITVVFIKFGIQEKSTFIYFQF
jgi:D-alanyl-lipoteichoic acid acyltransferase DltB (MBOAT superfamily)